MADLPVVDSGVDQTGRPFVTLAGGRTFLGFSPTMAQAYLYRYFIPSGVKERLAPAAAGVAYDISLRYLGPPPDVSELAEGKYYEFGPGEVVVEVGAFIGYYAMRAAEIVGSAGSVVAVEAIPENAALLRANVEANPDLAIKVVEKAVWRDACQLTFDRQSRQAASALPGIVRPDETTTVQASSLDEILLDLGVQSVDFVRIQVNGAEKEVLEGMSNTLAQNPTLLIAAIYDRDGAPSWLAVEKMLIERGYATSVANGNVLATPILPD